MKTYDIYEAAAVCKCHPETIREYIRSGHLAASMPGRKYCITQPALDAFLTELENARVLASLESRSEQKCRSINAKTVSITLTSQRKAVNVLDNLLARKKKMKSKGCTTN
ncbi:excisionase family DNA-binding protein [Neisseria sicca]|uniref:excisionase family DNA-binding protein n=1 Tax=Neisseria sicca TaxID=490 RepID=UPI0009D9436B|nr:excisionase family DNA-binding protein [Neisseria sicca]